MSPLVKGLIAILAIVTLFSVISQWRLMMLVHLLMGVAIGFVLGATWMYFRKTRSSRNPAGDKTRDRL